MRLRGMFANQTCIGERKELLFIDTPGDFNMKGAGMLVVLLRGLNFGAWSHLGCSNIFSRQGLVKSCT